MRVILAQRVKEKIEPRHLMVKRLTIFQINDVHGYLEPHPELIWTPNGPVYPMMGGYARIASLLSKARRENPDGVIALDNGDTFHGTYPAVASKGQSLVPIVNALKLDAMTAHWEFAWGPKHFAELASRLTYPTLAINCYDKQSGDRPFPSSVILQRAGLRIAIIGIAATIVDKSMPPHFSEGVRFTSGFDELPDEIAKSRSAGANLIVVLSHLGFPQDAELAGSVPGIDVVVSGHTHNRLEHPVRIRETVIIQSGCHGSFVGMLELFVEGDRIVETKHRLIPVDDTVLPDRELEALIDGVMMPYRRMLDEVVGRTRIGLHRNTTLYSTMDDALLAAIAAAAQTDMAFSNGWRYGAPIPPGPVTVNDLWNIIPTNPPVSCVDLTGAEIREMMEENLERTFSPDALGQMGGYLKRCRGLTLYGKIENPRGHRIERIFTGSDEIEASRTYRAAFVTEQGVPKSIGRNRRDLPIDAITALQRYFEAPRQEPDLQVGRFLPS